MSHGIHHNDRTPGGVVETLRAMPLSARRDAVKKIMAAGSEDDKRLATLAANEIPAPGEAPGNKRQAPVMTK